MSDEQGVRNHIAGVVKSGIIVQGRDISINLPRVAHSAVAGLPGQPIFVGRDQELEKLCRVLDPASQSKSRAALTIFGLPGVGKTALAVRVAYRADELGWFPGGVIILNMRGYDPPEQRLDTMTALAILLGTVGIPEDDLPKDGEARELLWRSTLSARADSGLSTLIIFDNASDLEQVRPLLPANGEHGVLITSRHNLGVQGFRLLEVDVLSLEDAVDQLESELEFADPEDARCSIEPSSAVELVELCGRLPLAINIAAALLTVVRERPISRAVDAMRDERARLSELNFDGSVAVRATFDLSYAYLSSEQARVFRLAAINPGAEVCVDAVAALCDFDVPRVRRVLVQLARAHLISLSGEMRCGMHDLVRIYATEHATRDPEYRQALDRLFEYYKRGALDVDLLLRSAEGISASGGQFSGYPQALDWIDTECRNLVASVALAASNEFHEYAADLPAIMCNYFHMRRRWDDWITVHRLALDSAIALGDVYREAVTRNHLGIAYREVGRLSDAVDSHRDAVRLFHGIRDFRRLVEVQGNLGIAFLEMGEFQEAADQISSTLEFSELVDDVRGRALSLVNLGLAQKNLGQLDESMRSLRASVSLFRQVGDHRAEAMALINVVYAHLEYEDFGLAKDVCLRAKEIAGNLGDSYLLVESLNLLGRANIALEDYLEARRHHGDALELSRSLGDLQPQGDALFGLAVCCERQKSLRDAVEFYEECLRVERKLENRLTEASVLNNLGNVYFGLESSEKAIFCWNSALEIFSSLQGEFAEERAAALRRTLRHLIDE